MGKIKHKGIFLLWLTIIRQSQLINIRNPKIDSTRYFFFTYSDYSVSVELVVDSNNRKLKYFLLAQRFELTEYFIYSKIAKLAKKNKNTLEKLSTDSLKHSEFWENITKQKISEDKFKIWIFVGLTKVFGLTFIIKMLENEEKKAEKIYEEITKSDKKYDWIVEEEKKHEKDVIGLIDEEYLKYVSSIVLGSSDALVELTGTLAGLTLSLQNNRLIGTTGLITGIAASLSMASSEYLSTKSSPDKKNPFRAAIYTGITYVITTTLLIFPYFVLHNYFFSLGWTLFNAVIIILFSSFYLSVTQEISFKRRFLEGVSLSFGVAIASFLIGILVNHFLHVAI